MGAWSFVDRRSWSAVLAQHRPPHRSRPDYVGRAWMRASPATGLAKVHASEQAGLVANAR